MTDSETTQQPPEAPVTVAEGPGEPVGRDWREEMETTHRARQAVHQLRVLAEEAGPDLLPGVDLDAVVEEFERMRAALAASWYRAADLLEAVPHNPTALTGPYWYGEGWDDAVHHLRDLADGMKPVPRRPSPHSDDPKGRP
ncbi:hypothetical protein ACFU7Y_02820 [Kitasatospora sp. NPDC057542]|uniref:hypothetical protein n=1 Tax=Kitasatospora sp. NPDC057542 TaxID=3346162 RepID=UPI003678573C